MSILLLPSAKYKVIDDSNNNAVGWKIFTYVAGTLNPKATYTARTSGVANTNPIILDARGEADVWWDGSYKIVIKDKHDVTKYTVDNYQGEEGTAVTIISNITALRALTAGGTTVFVNGYYDDGDGGGGEFYWDSASTETDNGGTIIKATAVTTGRWKRLLSGDINALWFGVSVSATAAVNGVALQKAVNVASTIGRSVYLPKGYYQSDATIRLYYDASTNPDFQSAGQGGKMRLYGDNEIDNTSLRFLQSTDTNVRGTVIDYTGSTGNAIELAKDSSTASLKAELERLTVVGDTTGYLISSPYNPEGKLKNVSIRVKNNNGLGISWGNAWFGSLIGVWILGETVVNPDGTGDKLTGSASLGFHINNTIEGGLYNLDRVSVDGFYRDYFAEGSAFIANLTLNNCAIQSCHNSGFSADVEIYSLIINQPYLEFNRGVPIRLVTSKQIHALKINGIYDLDANQLNATRSGGCIIYLDGPITYEIDGVATFRTYRDFLRVGNSNVSQAKGYIGNAELKTDKGSEFPTTSGTGLTIDTTVVGGIVTVSAINAGGTGYAANDIVYILSDDGTRDAVITIDTVSSGVVTAITLNEGGEGFTSSGTGIATQGLEVFLVNNQKSGGRYPQIKKNYDIESVFNLVPVGERVRYDQSSDADIATVRDMGNITATVNLTAGQLHPVVIGANTSGADRVVNLPDVATLPVDYLRCRIIHDGTTGANNLVVRTKTSANLVGTLAADQYIDVLLDKVNDRVLGFGVVTLTRDAE